ncbi:MAG: two-component sensor histidine kinase [Cypionkella sp.]|uniref:sensor histidine kinase n=1 Tax=Cypionkella sp. TaxID=2811411 RepID=UPI002626A53B|nr:sensor histidine kinase KdpD [Cypionkella sp.]MDB5661179.1 two-component sensor histidine kinase [Cypionkella sp.]
MKPVADPRPSPAALLERANREGRGRLKIFIGAAPGVGKTWAMLDDGHREWAKGVDVVAAVIETHGRAETEAKLADLPLLPRKPVLYKNRALTEMDLDALLARHPTLALIDELAHTNAEGGRHEKRWQDVAEVLAAGIDVYTTLNIQHIETLNETVARITGVRVRETVPDQVLELADEIELIDLPPDELLERLKAGKIYPQDQAARAINSFFIKGNLTALRELAMRTAADRVDAQLREHMAANAIEGPWPTQERILVCLNDSPAAREAIRVAKRSADRARADWIAVNVTSARQHDFGEAQRDRISTALRLAERLGAEVATIEAEQDTASAILSYARARNVRRIIVGYPRRRSVLTRWLHEDVVQNLMRRAGSFEITVASQLDAQLDPTRTLTPLQRPTRRGLIEAAGITVLANAAAVLADNLFPVASLSLIFMTAVIIVASRQGNFPAIVASILGFFSFDFFFVDPRFDFTITDRSEVLTLGLFLVASLITGNLAARLRHRATVQAEISERTNKLYDFSRKVAAASQKDDLIWAVVSHVAVTLRCESLLLMPNASETLQIVGGFPPEDQLDVRDQMAAQYTWDKGEAAGRGSNTLPTARWYFMPLKTTTRRFGVLGIAFDDDGALLRLDPRLMEALSDQIVLALERLGLTEDLAATRLATETERLRSALLSSVSHDLRTPLVTIIGAAGSLTDPEGLPEASRRELAELIREEGERLDRYVQNLLDMTRLGHGALRPKLSAVDLAEVVGSARHRMRAILRLHPLTTDLPETLPPVQADPVLLEQVLFNIIDNAVKYSPEGSEISLSAKTNGSLLTLTIADSGPGIPLEDRDRIFEMFYRVEGGDRQRAGTGLGLAICKGLIESMGGSIRAEATWPNGTGTRIVMTLQIHAPAAIT